MRWLSSSSIIIFACACGSVEPPADPDAAHIEDAARPDAPPDASLTCHTDPEGPNLECGSCAQVPGGTPGCFRCRMTSPASDDFPGATQTLDGECCQFDCCQQARVDPWPACGAPPADAGAPTVCQPDTSGLGSGCYSCSERPSVATGCDVECVLVPNGDHPEVVRAGPCCDITCCRISTQNPWPRCDQVPQ